MEAETLRRRVEEWWEHLLREQKISVVLLFLFTIMTVVLSGLHIRSQIFAPFMISKTRLAKSDAIYAQQNLEEKKNAELRIKDTDHDGLTDYAELSIYHTSAYLADTDSDGIPDSIEIAQGTNPLCPEGKNCMGTGVAAVVGSTTSTLVDLLGATPLPRVPGEVTSPNATGTAGAQAFVDQPPPPDQMTPTQIRTYLVSHGLVTDQQLSALTDEMVIQVYVAAYQEALRVQAARTVPSPSSSSPSSTH